MTLVHCTGLSASHCAQVTALYTLAIAQLLLLAFLLDPLTLEQYQRGGTASRWAKLAAYGLVAGLATLPLVKPIDALFHTQQRTVNRADTHGSSDEDLDGGCEASVIARQGIVAAWDASTLRNALEQWAATIVQMAADAVNARLLSVRSGRRNEQVVHGIYDKMRRELASLAYGAGPHLRRRLALAREAFGPVAPAAALEVVDASVVGDSRAPLAELLGEAAPGAAEELMSRGPAPAPLSSVALAAADATEAELADHVTWSEAEQTDLARRARRVLNGAQIDIARVARGRHARRPPPPPPPEEVARGVLAKIDLAAMAAATAAAAAAMGFDGEAAHQVARAVIALQASWRRLQSMKRARRAAAEKRAAAMLLRIVRAWLARRRFLQVVQLAKEQQAAAAVQRAWRFHKDPPAEALLHRSLGRPARIAPPTETPRPRWRDKPVPASVRRELAKVAPFATVWVTAHVFEHWRLVVADPGFTAPPSNNADDTLAGPPATESNTPAAGVASLPLPTTGDSSTKLGRAGQRLAARVRATPYVGAALGAGIERWFKLWASPSWWRAFPWGLLGLANLLACLAVLSLYARYMASSPTAVGALGLAWLHALAIGLLGGHTLLVVMRNHAGEDTCCARARRRAHRQLIAPTRWPAPGARRRSDRASTRSESEQAAT